MTRHASSRPAISWRSSRRGWAPRPEVGVVQRLLLPAPTALHSYTDPDGGCSDGWPYSPTGCSSWPAPPSRARITSWPTSTRCARRCCRCVTSLCWRRCWRRPAEHGLPGLIVDTDLRWRLVTTLAAAGDIDNEGSRRRSSTPRPSAIPPPAGSARGPGGPPDRRPAVKDTAWHRVVGDDSLPNITAGRSSAASRSPASPRSSSPTRPGTSPPYPGVGATVQRGRADGRRRAVPVVVDQRDALDATTASWRVNGHRRCTGSCSRAAQASNARCGPEPSTSPRRERQLITLIALMRPPIRLS